MFSTDQPFLKCAEISASNQYIAIKDEIPYVKMEKGTGQRLK